MKFSRLFTSFSNNIYKGIFFEGYKFLLNSGSIYKNFNGIYSFLPIGCILINNLIKIIKKEMNNLQLNEVILPLLQSDSLWRLSDRWEKYGNELLKIKDRNGRLFCLSPTNEEIITYLLKFSINKYNFYPYGFYQVNYKFRDEIRPRVGLLRLKEFLMKDAYVFYNNSHKYFIFFEKLISSYKKIFSFLNINFCLTRAETGKIGGSESYEFNALVKEGENKIIVCKHCRYISNLETSYCFLDYSLFFSNFDNELSVSNFKIILYFYSDFYYFFILDSLKEINEFKIKKIFLDEKIDKSDFIFSNVFAFFEFLKNKNFFFILDFDMLYCDFFFLKDKFFNLNIFSFFFYNFDFYNISKIINFSKCFKCSNKINVIETIEIGHVFDLNIKYSKMFNLTSNNSYIRSGCFGIGVSRLLFIFIESNLKNNVVKWPLKLVPFKIILVCIFNNLFYNYISNIIYKNIGFLSSKILLDNRKLNPGEKLHDSDFLSFPFVIKIGKNFVKNFLIDIRINYFGKKRIFLIHFEKIFDFFLYFFSKKKCE